MNVEKQARAIQLRADGWTIQAIADELGVWPNSVQWMLRRGELLEKERERRKEEGMEDHNCGRCGAPGHNTTSHGVARRRRRR